jgi:hypothetical protein
MVLPIVLACSTILTILMTMLISHLSRGWQIEKLHLEALRAQYAAESGIALIQNQLKKNIHEKGKKTFSIQGMRVEGEYFYTKGDVIQIRSTAFAKYDVRQTIEVHVSKETMEILQWIR